MATGRNQGIELLRLVLMFFVVTEHVLGHGVGLLDVIIGNVSPDSSFSNMYWAMYSTCLMSVNCFVFISGYYGIKFNTKRLLSLWLQALTISLLLLFVNFLIGNPCGLKLLLISFFPILSNYWWFLSNYILLFCLSPLLNKFVIDIDKRSQIILLSIIFILVYIGGLMFNTVQANLGYSIVNFIFIYLLAQFLSKINFFEKFTIKHFIFAFIISTLILVVLVVNTIELGPFFLKRLIAYNNPIVLICAILFFGIFYHLPLRFEIQKISSCAFGIYLLHDNEVIRPLLSDLASSIGLFSILLVFFASFFVEYLRSYISSRFGLNDFVYKLLRL